ncbi:hypothetical protein BDZ97DRAFT_1947964 [Flammula alnicola]|nr:hypothetical protein BDZ97DRAFT_1947964 [Flammula alnicola]
MAWMALNLTLDKDLSKDRDESSDPLTTNGKGGIAKILPLLQQCFGDEHMSSLRVVWPSSPSQEHLWRGFFDLEDQPKGVAVIPYKSSFRALYSMVREDHKDPAVYKLICAGPEERMVSLDIIGMSSDVIQGFAVLSRWARGSMI